MESFELKGTSNSGIARLRVDFGRVRRLVGMLDGVYRRVCLQDEEFEQNPED